MEIGLWSLGDYEMMHVIAVFRQNSGRKKATINTENDVTIFMAEFIAVEDQGIRFLFE